MSKKPTGTGEKRSAETEENVSNKRPALENADGGLAEGADSNAMVISSSAHNDQEYDKTPPAIILRSVISTRNVGAIIGKAGANIKMFREETGTRITISEETSGTYERILTVSGSAPGVAKAFGLISVKIQESDTTPGQAPPKLMAKILVSNGQVGSIIGKAGAKIKEIQENTRARVVISEEILANSTERCVTVSGTSESIEAALELVINQLIDNPEKGQNVPYRPTRYGMPQSSSSSSSYANQYAAYPAYDQGYAPGYAGFGVTNHFSLNSQPTTQQLYIPNELVGCIIGKGGSKISEIRQQSGSQIKIGELQSNTNERLVSIIGTPESNQMALFLLYARLQQERSRLARS